MWQKGKIGNLRKQDRIRQLEIELVVELCLENRNIKKVLDIGTGSGLFAEAFIIKGLNVFGIDPDPEMISAACYYVPSAKFQLAIAEALPFANDSFNISFMGLVLHETNDPLIALLEAKRASKDLVAILEWPHGQKSKSATVARRFSDEELRVIIKKINFRNYSIHRLTNFILYLLEL